MVNFLIQGKSLNALVDVWDSKTQGLEMKFKYLCEWILIHYVFFSRYCLYLRMLCMLSTESYTFPAIADNYKVISLGVPME